MARPEKQIDAEILEVLSSYPEVTCGRIALLTGYGSRMVKTRLRRFVSLGLVSQRQERMRIHYTLSNAHLTQAKQQSISGAHAERIADIYGL